MFKYINELLTLSFPITVARIGTFLIVFIDVIMIGGEGAFAFNAYNSANLINTAFWLMGISALFGIRILISQNSQNSDESLIQAIVSEGVYFAIGIASCLFILSLFSHSWIPLFGYSEDTYKAMIPVIICLGVGLFGHMVYAAIAFYLEATEKAKVAMWIVLFGIILNFALNHLFVSLFEGTSHSYLIAIATSVVRTVMCLFAILYVIKICKINPFSRSKRHESRVYARKELYGHGVASIAIASMSFVSVFFSSIMESIGIIEAAAFHIFMSLVGLISNFTSGVASALSIKVGRSYSTGDYSDITHYCMATLWISVAVSVLFHAISLFAGGFVVGFYSTENDVITKSLEYLVVCGFIFVFCDVFIKGASGVSRGLGDKKFTTLTIVLANIVGVMLAYFMCISLNMDSYYLFICVAMVNLVSSILIALKSIQIINEQQTLNRQSIGA
ncbi:MATE family efflux transporter [Pseudoalteromonas sp. MTN2-4]|uniref:MATE family efflux transporter n=1 Tax=Pseudoalteromonas sp. MTN2-4 TaxID=3056555 RepID=UPI0036F325B9